LFFDRLRVEAPQPDGSGCESGPDVGLGRSPSPMALASSVAAWIDTPSRTRAMTPPADAACRRVFGNRRPEIDQRRRVVEARMHDADDRARRAVEKSGFETERLQRDRRVRRCQGRPGSTGATRRR
jgi:hypothetical protein